MILTPIAQSRHDIHRKVLKPLFRIFITALLLLLIPTGCRKQEPQTVRLLTVGNSFADNALTYLPQIVEASGNILIYERANLGGCSLKRHWDHAAKYQADSNDPEGSPYSDENYSLMQLLRKDAWDFITIQQVSWESHDLKTYDPYVIDLCQYISDEKPEARIMAHQIWSYRIDDPRFIPENKGKEPHTQQIMWKQVRKAYHHIAEELNLGILPSGDAMYLADSNPQWGYKADRSFDPEQAKYPEIPDQTHSLHTGWYWNKRPDETYQLNMDGHHANKTGEYLLGCVWFEVFYEQSVVGNAFYPEHLDAKYARFLQQTAHKAVSGLKN